METAEPLESGYGPSTPAGDNLCNDFAQGMADAYTGLARARDARVRDDPDLALTLLDGGSPALFGNLAVLRRPLVDDEWRAAAERMHGFFAEQPGGSFLVFSAWPTPDFVHLDYGRVGHPPLMLRPPAPVQVEPVEGLEIRPVTDAAGAEDWERSLVEGFPEPDLQPFRPGCLLPHGALAVPRWHHWVAYLDGEAVGTASAYVEDHHVHIEFISTLERARGRGIGRALTATATSVGPELPALLMSSDLGRPVYERLGFGALLRYTLWAGHRQVRETG